MEQNVGGIDRPIRLVSGLLFMLAGLFMPVDAGWRITLLVIGAVAFITGITGL